MVADGDNPQKAKYQNPSTLNSPLRQADASPQPGNGYLVGQTQNCLKANQPLPGSISGGQQKR